jgi:hypothetical protein
MIHHHRLAKKHSTVKQRWWSFFHKRCLVGFPWYLPARPPGDSAMVAARRAVRQHFGRNYHPVNRALGKILTTIVWPPAVVIHLWQIRRLNGPRLVPISRALGALWCAMRHNILPSEYYGYELWRADRETNIDNYFYCNEAARLFKVINRPSQPDLVGDKLAFHEMCKVHALPTPPILASFTPTGKVLDFEEGRPPKRGLFVKPRLGFGGGGAERFRWNGVIFENDGGSRLKLEELSPYLVDRARKENRELLVQPLLESCPKLRAAEALTIARLITGCSMDGHAVPVFAFAYFSRFDYRKETEPWTFEGLINVTTGRKITGSLQSSPGTSTQNNLDSDAMLPDWDVVLNYVKAAHRACCSFGFLAWDVALTDQGPMLLEGNVNWSPGTFQFLTGKPLGHTIFATILATRLNSKIAESPG